MKKMYRVEVCHINRLFGLNPKITSRSFYNKDNAKSYVKKIEKSKNKFVWAKLENGKETKL